MVDFANSLQNRYLFDNLSEYILPFEKHDEKLCFKDFIF